LSKIKNHSARAEIHKKKSDTLIAFFSFLSQSLNLHDIILGIILPFLAHLFTYFYVDIFNPEFGKKAFFGPPTHLLIIIEHPPRSEMLAYTFPTDNSTSDFSCLSIR
jgi:hypothetical protein